MNILFVSAEAVPYAKVGGLADVVGSLPTALQELGHDVRVMMPFYGQLRGKHNINHMFSFPFTHRLGTADTHLHTAVQQTIPYYFLEAWPYFGQENSVYTEWNWDMPRFIFFNQMVMAAIWELKQRLGWFPDIVHVHDWHTGLVPFLVANNRGNPEWQGIGTVLTIHNMAYQGGYGGGWLFEAGIPGRQQPDLVYQDLTDNLLAIAIAYADIVTTVSPRYSVEIRYPHMGEGLDGLIRARAADLYGVLNGIDTRLWNPETDPYIVSRFNAENFVEKRPPNKHQLQADAGLPVREDVPVIGIVTRIVAQKGIDLAIPALRQLLVDRDVQVVALGAGDPDLSFALARLAWDFGWKMRAFLEYNAALAQRIYAGCDVFLMPSRYEPCGIGQMLAMRYGALPLVRETGGLADTVENYDNGPAERGTGFVFSWEEADAVLNTLRWAIDTYTYRKEEWQRMQARAMQLDFSWTASARHYVDLYLKALDKHGRVAGV